jgi:hypothetical protein
VVEGGAVKAFVEYTRLSIWVVSAAYLYGEAFAGSWPWLIFAFYLTCAAWYNRPWVRRSH